MELIENKTKFKHTGMPSWGIGIYRKSDGDCVFIDFENVGLKKLSKEFLNSKLIKIKETNEYSTDQNKKYKPISSDDLASDFNGTLVQFDGETDGFSDKNIIEAFEGNDSVIFNESYVIVGEHTKALKIHAMYDLTIIGDLTVQECVVNGSLTVIGEAHIEKLSCFNTFVCKGNLLSAKIYVGGDINVESIVCDELVCDGNVILQTTANINSRAEIGRTIVACEGIMGAGNFSAFNAIANEYFEFDGYYEGKILELESDTTIMDTIPQRQQEDETIEGIFDKVNKALKKEYEKCSTLDENEIVKHLKSLNSFQSNELKVLPIIELMFSKLSQISYNDRIETIDEYLLVVFSKMLLPENVFNYESIEHVGGSFLDKAKSEFETLEFNPCTIEEFSKTLSMAVKLSDELDVDLDVLMDKIFESVGLRYSTVVSMLNRNRPNKSGDSSKEVVPNGKEKKHMISKSEFLEKKLSDHKKKLGLTDVEIEKMAAMKIRTFGEFLQASDADLTKMYGKKPFLAKHLIQIRDKINNKLINME